jgi:hypothetical protein
MACPPVGQDGRATPQQMVELMREQIAGMPFRWDPYMPAGPFVLPWSRGAELERVGARLIELLDEAVRRLGPDPQARHTLLGIDQPLIGLYNSPEFEDRYSAIMSRSDVVMTATGWKFIEFNLSFSIGGQSYVYLLNDLWRRTNPAVRDGRIRMTEPLSRRAQMLRSIADELGLEPRIAAIGCIDDLGGTDLHYYDVEIDELARAGFEAAYFEPDDFVKALNTDGLRFPMALQEIIPQDWLDDGRGVAAIEAIRRSGTAMMSPQTSYQLSNKQILAMLSAGQPWMSEEDRDLVTTYVPWIRVIQNGEIDYQGATWPMPRLLIEAREQFVLKPPDKNSGVGILVGRVTDPQTWQAAVDTALRAGRWVAQEFVIPRPMLADVVDMRNGTYAQVESSVVFGPFMVRGELAGCWARFDFAYDGGTIMLSGHPTTHMSSVAWQV